MPDISRTELTRYSSLEIYRLVDDIESYSEFLPWCRSSTVHDRSEVHVEASLELHKSGISRTFTTRNCFVIGERIEIGLIDGPFHHLDGTWMFESLSDSESRVSLDVSYQFDNPLVGLVFGPSFDHIVSSLVGAFVERAVNVYGRR